MFKKTYRPMRAVFLAGVLSIAAASAAQAGGRAVGSDFHSDASTAPADDTGPGSAGDHNGRSQKKADDGQLSGDWHPVLAGDGGPGGPGDDNGRSAALITGDWHPVLAGDGGPTTAGDHNGRSAALTGDWHPMLAGGRGGLSGDV
jgi:hypothetical protein